MAIFNSYVKLPEGKYNLCPAPAVLDLAISQDPCFSTRAPGLVWFEFPWMWALSLPSSRSWVKSSASPTELSASRSPPQRLRLKGAAIGQGWESQKGEQIYSGSMNLVGSCVCPSLKNLPSCHRSFPAIFWLNHPCLSIFAIFAIFRHFPMAIWWGKSHTWPLLQGDQWWPEPLTGHFRAEPVPPMELSGGNRWHRRFRQATFQRRKDVANAVPCNIICMIVWLEVAWSCGPRIPTRSTSLFIDYC